MLAPSCTDFDIQICEVDPAQGAEAPWAIVAPEVMRLIVDCLDAADCTSRLACVETVITQYGIDF